MIIIITIRQKLILIYLIQDEKNFIIEKLNF